MHRSVWNVQLFQNVMNIHFEKAYVSKVLAHSLHHDYRTAIFWFFKTWWQAIEPTCISCALDPVLATMEHHLVSATSSKIYVGYTSYTVSGMWKRKRLIFWGSGSTLKKIAGSESEFGSIWLFEEPKAEAICINRCASASSNLATFFGIKFNKKGFWLTIYVQSFHCSYGVKLPQ